MTKDEVMARLGTMTDAQTHKRNVKMGVEQGQIGIKQGDIRNLAKEIKMNQELGAELWNLGQHEAMLLACQIMSPKKLSVEEMDKMAHQIQSVPVADGFNTSLSKPHPQKGVLREKWMQSDQEFVLRSGWSLTTDKVLKDPEGMDMSAMLDKIEREMPSASSDVQWMMNYCLASIGIEYPELRQRAIGIGEKIGAFKDYPVSKGCVSPYAPIWITEMVSRKG